MKFQITVYVGNGRRALIAADCIGWLPDKAVLAAWSLGRYSEIPAHLIEDIDYIIDEETYGTWPTIEPPVTDADISSMCLDAEAFANGEAG
jgi:hypothetical protein